MGREAELAQARGLVSDLLGGQGSTLLIEGEAGIGKTGFVRWLIEEARAAGVTLFLGEARAFERTRPFGAVADALGLRRRSSDPRRAAVGRLLAGDTEARGSEAGAGQDLRHRIVEEVVDLLELECGQSPVLLVIEDLHWADGSTLLAVHSLMHRMVHVPLLLVLSLRPSPRSADLHQLYD